MLLHEKFELDFNDAVLQMNLKENELIDQSEFLQLFSNLGFFKNKVGESE